MNEQIFNFPRNSRNDSQSSGSAQTPLEFVAVEMQISPSLAVNKLEIVGKLNEIFNSK